MDDGELFGEGNISFARDGPPETIRLNAHIGEGGRLLGRQLPARASPKAAFPPLFGRHLSHFDPIRYQRCSGARVGMDLHDGREGTFGSADRPA